MNRNLFLKEIRRNLTGLMVWTVIITVLITVTMSVFPTFIENQSRVFAMFDILPKELLQFKGISRISDLQSVLGFYAVNNIIYMMVLGSVYGIVLSSGILLKEEYNKTAEYLLSRPLTRSEVFFSKLAVVSVNVFFLNAFTTLAGFASIELVTSDPYNVEAFLILSLFTFLLNFLFGAAGLFLSTIVKRPKPITALSIGLVLILYFIFTISKITDRFSDIGYLSPFRYINTEVTDPAYGIDIVNLLYFTVLTMLLLFFSCRLYLRRDIYT